MGRPAPAPRYTGRWTASTCAWPAASAWRRCASCARCHPDFAHVAAFRRMGPAVCQLFCPSSLFLRSHVKCLTNPIIRRTCVLAEVLHSVKQLRPGSRPGLDAQRHLKEPDCQHVGFWILDLLRRLGHHDVLRLFISFFLLGRSQQNSRTFMMTWLLRRFAIYTSPSVIFASAESFLSPSCMIQFRFS